MQKTLMNQTLCGKDERLEITGVDILLSLLHIQV